MGIGRKIYFDEKKHKYTDDLNNPYTSVTTLIGKYEEPFRKREMAKMCSIKGQGIYAGKTTNQILAMWDKMTKDACEKGNKKHSYFEENVKKCSGFKERIKLGYGGKLLYTVFDIMDNHTFGILNLSDFEEMGVKENYPSVYAVIEDYVNKGYHIYAEIGTYNEEHLISGLIDILFVHWPTRKFVILDWKTNKTKLRWDSGYYKRGKDGELTEEWKATYQYYKYPINRLQQSKGNGYALQLSMYSYLVETFGLNLDHILLAHIRHHKYTETTVNDFPPLRNLLGDDLSVLIGKDVVDFHPMPYLKDDIIKLIDHHTSKSNRTRNNQTTLII